MQQDDLSVAPTQMISPSGVIIDTVVSWRREMPEAALNAAASSAPRR